MGIRCPKCGVVYSHVLIRKKVKNAVGKPGDENYEPPVYDYVSNHVCKPKDIKRYQRFLLKQNSNE